MTCLATPQHADIRVPGAKIRAAEAVLLDESPDAAAPALKIQSHAVTLTVLPKTIRTVRLLLDP